MRIIEISLFVCGIGILFRKGMLLHWLIKPIYTIVDNEGANPYLVYFCKPLFYCTICMTSIWGGGYYYYLYGNIDILFLIRCIPVVAIINTIISMLFKLNSKL